MLPDTNILIYLSKPGGEAIEGAFKATRPITSIVCKIEAFGFNRITAKEIADLDAVFRWVQVVPVTDEIADRAIRLRQSKRVSLGDSIIAATALVYGVPVCTRNVEDFEGIGGVRIQNPFADLR